MPEITQKLGFDAKKAISNLGSLSTKLDTATTSLANFQNQAGKTGVSGVDKTLDKAKKKTQEFTLSWKTMARILQTQLALRGINFFVGQLKEGVVAARELGLAVEEIQTIAGGKLAGSAALTQDIISLSDALGKSSQDLAEAFYQTISNQVVDVGDALNFTSQAAKLATVTVSETKDAVNALSSVMNSYGFEASKAEHVADTLFKTVELGRLRLSEIANVIGRVTPLTAAMGVEWEEAAASIAVMTRQGVRADTAITQLRAVMTKIIRPTQEMRDIFRSWGVKDGKQAVETFGGLVGVLKKLAVETGGSSAEMADLLRRVRTIVGQLSIMTNGGEDLVDTMAKIKNAIGEVSSKWDEFTESEAFRLTAEMNKFENITTRLGTTSLPALGKTLEGINWFLENNIRGWTVILGQMDESAKQAEIIRKIVKKTAEQQSEDATKFAKEQTEKYEGLTEAASQYYVEAQKAEFRLANLRDNLIDRAEEKIKLQGKSILTFYKAAGKSLEKFISDTNNKIKADTEKIADIQKEIESRQRDTQLKNIKGNYRKLFFLEKELAAQRKKFRDAFGDLDATEESKERALAEGETAIEMAKQALAIAKQEGHARTIANWEDMILGLLVNQQEVHKQSVKERKNAVPEARKLYAEQQRGEKELQALLKQRAALIDSGALEARSEELRRNAEVELNEIEGRINEIFTDTARGDAFLKSVGVENFKKITDGLSIALSQSRKDWSLEVAAAKAAFAHEIIPITIAIDPTGVKKQAAEALGIQRIEGEDPIAFDRRIGEQAVEILQQYEQTLESIGDKEELINDQYLVANRLLKEGVAISKRRFESAKVGIEIITKVREWAKLSVATQEELNKAVEKTTLSQQGYAIALERSLQAFMEASTQGQAATKADIELLRQQLLLAEQTGAVTAAQADKYRAVINALNETKGKVQELNQLQEDLPEKEKIKAARRVVAELEKQKVSLQGQKNAQEASAKAADTMSKRIQNGKEAMKEFTGEANNAKQAVNETAQDTASLGPAAASQIGQVNALAVAYQRMAKAALAAARAQSAVGTATAYHGGPMRRYFADGGVMGRGQDKIITALSQGETVINSKQSKRFFSELNAMNQGSQPVFREQGGPVTNVGDVNVTVNGGDSSQQTVREIGRALRRQVQRGNIKLH